MYYILKVKEIFEPNQINEDMFSIIVEEGNLKEHKEMYDEKADAFIATKGCEYKTFFENKNDLIKEINRFLENIVSSLISHLEFRPEDLEAKKYIIGFKEVMEFDFVREINEIEKKANMIFSNFPKDTYYFNEKNLKLNKQNDEKTIALHKSKEGFLMSFTQSVQDNRNRKILYFANLNVDMDNFPDFIKDFSIKNSVNSNVTIAFSKEKIIEVANKELNKQKKAIEKRQQELEQGI